MTILHGATVYDKLKKGNKRLDDRQIKDKRTEQERLDLDLKKDRPFHSFFSKTQPLSIIIKGVVPEFRGMSAKEIEKYIEIEFEEKDSEVEYDSKAKLLESKSKAEGEAVTEFDIYFRLNLPNGTKARFALFLDLEMQQDFSPGYDIVKRSVYYPARMVGKQLTSLHDQKAYNQLQKVHTIWVFTTGFSRELSSHILTYSLRRPWTPEERSMKAILKLDRRIDLIDISYLFVDEKLDGEASEVIAFLNTCFYHKENLKDHPEWMDPEDNELKEAADSMDNFAVFYEKRGKKLGKAIGETQKVIEMIKGGIESNLSDSEMLRYFCITSKELTEIKALIGRYPEIPAQELAETYLNEIEKDVS